MNQLRSLRTLILGLGNPLSGDDGFGARVLEILQRNGIGSLPGIVLADAHTDLLNHIESFAEYDRVVLIDAILDPANRLGSPGRIVILHEKEFLSWSETSSSVHQMSPLLAVKLFRQLYPESQTRISLVGLLVDRINHAPHYATEERIDEAVSAIETGFLGAI